MRTMQVLWRTVIALRHGGPRWSFALPGTLGWALLALLTGGTNVVPSRLIEPQSGERFIGCALMLLAMMGPFADEGLRHVHFRSIAPRRRRACATFLAGYGLACLATAASFVGVMRVLQETAPSWPAAGAAAVTLLAGAAWHGMAFRARVLAACHARPPLAAFGWHADRDALVHGLRLGLRCAACGAPLMLATMFQVAALPLMGIALAIACQERLGARDRRREWRVLILAVALACAAWAEWGGSELSVGEICRAGSRAL